MSENAPESQPDRRGEVVYDKEGRSYHIEDYVGKGGCAAVWVVVEDETQCTFAMKEVKLTEDLDEKIRKAIMAEVELMERVSHPYIIKYQSHYISDNEIRLFLEYMEKYSLLTSIEKNTRKCLPVAAARRYTQQILEALKYLHEELHVAHRDLKCANILLDKRGNIKLADFGLATQLEPGKPKDDPEIGFGSYNWMAPEILDQAGTEVSDCWSLGCTVVEMLTGQPPFSDLNPWAIMQLLMSEKGAPSLEGIEDKKIIEFLQECFVRDPAARKSTSELAQLEWVFSEQAPDSSLAKPFQARSPREMIRVLAAEALVLSIELIAFSGWSFNQFAVLETESVNSSKFNARNRFKKQDVDISDQEDRLKHLLDGVCELAPTVVQEPMHEHIALLLRSGGEFKAWNKSFLMNMSASAYIYLLLNFLVCSDGNWLEAYVEIEDGGVKNVAVATPEQEEADDDRDEDALLTMSGVVYGRRKALYREFHLPDRVVRLLADAALATEND